MRQKAFFPALLCLVSVVTVSCKDAYKFEELEKAVPVIKIEKFPKSPAQLDSTYTITVLYGPENGCGRYSNVKQTTESLTETIQLFAAYPTDPEVICADISKPIRYSFQYKFTQLGVQKFRFWKADGEYLDTTILVEPKKVTEAK